MSQGLSEIIDLCHQLHNLVQTMSDPLTTKEKSHIDRIAKVGLPSQVLSMLQSFGFRPRMQHYTSSVGLSVSLLLETNATNNTNVSSACSYICICNLLCM